MLRCEKCRHRDVSADKYPCSECDFNVNDLFEPKKQTNADRIRAMTDEELAKLFVYWDCDGADYSTDLPINGCKWGSKKEILSRVIDYLQSEVEV